MQRILFILTFLLGTQISFAQFDSIAAEAPATVKVGTYIIRYVLANIVAIGLALR